MQLSHPEGLWLLGLLVPLVLLYLFKGSQRTTRVSSVWLWSISERELQATRPWRKFRAQIPLLLQALAILLLALAATRPISVGGAVLVKYLAIVVDVSASMQALEPTGETRIELAHRAISERIRALEPGTEVLLITAGKTARVISPLERDRRKLLRHLQAISAVDTEGSLAQAVGLSASRLRQLGGERKLLVVTDGALLDARPLATSGVNTEVIQVGTAQDNTAIVRIFAKSEKAGDAGETWPVHVLASIKNYGRTLRNVQVTLRQRNVTEPLASRQVQLAPGEQAPVVLSFDAVKTDEGTGLVVELSPPDAMAVDDVAYASVPLMSRQPVLLSPKDKSPWLTRALLADPDVDLRGVAPDMLESAVVPLGALLVYVDHCPERVPPSNYLVINPPPGVCLLDEIEGNEQAAQVTDWKESDPRLRFLSLGGLQVNAARRIRTDSPERVLVDSQFGPIMTKQSLYGREGTLVSFSLSNSDWPRKASFVLFVRNVVELARNGRQGAQNGGHATGNPLRISIPTDVSEVSVEAPGGARQTLKAQSGVTLLPSADQAGFYYFSWMGETPGSTLLPANLSAAKESDLRETVIPQVFPGALARAAAKSRIVDWTWLLCGLALLFLLIDIWFFTRRRRSTNSDETTWTKVAAKVRIP